MEHRITTVDDEGEVRGALRRLFKVAGMNTVSYASAEEFLDALSGCSRDCLILDHGLPGMSDLELQRRPAANHRGIPIILFQLGTMHTRGRRPCRQVRSQSSGSRSATRSFCELLKRLCN